MKEFLVSICISLFVASIGYGQSFKGFPAIKNFTSGEYDGSVQNWDFAEDSNGVLYISNLQNIIKYDGVNWLDISVPNSRSYSIHLAENNRLFVGGVNEFGYLGPPKDSTLTVEQYYSLRSLIPDSLEVGRIFDITSSGNDIYFQTSEILIRYDGSKADYFLPEKAFSYVFNYKGEIYVREALEGLKKVDGDSLVLVPDGEYFAERNIFSYIGHPQKDLFCEYMQCSEFVNGSFRLVNMEVNAYLKTNYMDEAIVLQDETLLFATRLGGLVHTTVDGKILQIIDEDKGLISNMIYGIYEDKNGSVWAATVNGISRIDFELPLRFYDERSGISKDILKITEHRNNLIFGTTDKAYHINSDHEIETYTFTGMCSDDITVNNIFYLICDQNIHYYDGTNYTALQEIQAYKIALLKQPNMVFFGNASGFNVAALNRENYRVLYQLTDLTILPNSILVDESNTIWVGSNIGLNKIDLEWEGDTVIGHKLEHYFIDVKNIYDDKRSYVTSLGGEPAFLTWGKGIQRYDTQDQKMVQDLRYGSSFSDTSKQFYLAEEDLEGNIWFRYDSEYQAALKAENGDYKNYQGPLRLIDHQQSNDIYTRDEQFIWFGTDQGAVRYQKHHTFDHRFPFHTQINKVLVKNDSLINGGSKNQRTVLAYKDNEMRFTYAAASYFSPKETEYRSRLEGFEENWGIWTNESFKDYTNIPEGDYTFKVQARNVFGEISESAGYSFSILPPWYRTWWAYLLYTAFIAGVLYTAYKIRVNQLLRVERIRNHIASDLHDEVSATLSSITYFVQAIESDKVKGDKHRFLKLISGSAGDAKEKITDIVWAINPEHDDWQSFLSKCRRYASDLFESKEISYSLKIDEYIPGKLDMQLRQHLWLLFKEMITNVARHSDAKNVDIIMRYEQAHFKLVVQDDGRGMDVDQVQKGNGLVNIQKRAEQIGADINLKTSAGFGTRWNLKVPV